MKICSVDSCDRPHVSKGYCDAHYRRSRKGQPLDVPLGIANLIPEKTLDDLLARTEQVGDCLIWQGCRHPQSGYGMIQTKGRNVYAHRLSYELHSGTTLPKGYAVHHKCANGSCINPDHLQPVTSYDNSAEMLARRSYETYIKALQEALAQHDPNHPLLASTNTLIGVDA